MLEEVEKDGGLGLSEDDRSSLVLMQVACTELETRMVMLDEGIGLFCDP